MTIFHRITLRHFQRGWSLFWRMNLPFWILLFHACLALAIAFGLRDRLADWLASHPKFGGHPVLAILGLALAVYLVLAPAVLAVRRKILTLVEAEFWQAQFQMVASLGKFSRGLMALAAAFGSFLILEDGHVFAEAWVRGLMALLTAIILGVLTLFVGLYGWLAEQWNDDIRAPQ